MEAAAQLGQALAPMIMEQMEGQMGGAEGGAPAGDPGMEPAGAEPMFSKGGVFVGKR